MVVLGVQGTTAEQQQCCETLRGFIVSSQSWEDTNNHAGDWHGCGETSASRRDGVVLAHVLVAQVDASVHWWQIIEGKTVCIRNRWDQ